MNEKYTARENPRVSTVEFLPKKELQLSTKLIGAKLLSLDYEIVTETPFVVVAKREQEITVFPSGMMILKNTGDIEALGKIINEIYSAMGL